MPSAHITKTEKDSQNRAAKGYFGIGVEGISKPQNAGNLIRSAHAFGASFFFTINPALDLKGVRQSDTSYAVQNLPLYVFDDHDSMILPKYCQLVGVELTEDSIEIPSFRHPRCAAYVLGPEKGSLSPSLQEKCDHIIKIPMQFCVNVGVAGAIVMYDRLISLGRFAPRPVKSGGPTETLAPHIQGGRIIRTSKKS